jgi:arylformamidase
MRLDDPAWLDAQYDNRARVPGHAGVLERWARASALARERTSRRLDVRYGAGPNETLDVFPAPRANAPVLVFFHGGYWRALDKADHSFVAPAFVDGALVVVPNYALCPSVTVETIALQAARALAWTWRHAALYGGDAARIVVAGHSAGGQLAAMLLACDGTRLAPDLPRRMTARALAISGVFDLEPLRHAPFVQGDLRLTRDAVARTSPARFAAPDGARLHVFVGADESEEFLRQSALIRERWGAQAVPVCERVAGTNHFTVLHELAAPGSALHRSALDLLGPG